MGGVAAGVFIGVDHEVGGEGQTKGRGVESGAAGRPLLGCDSLPTGRRFRKEPPQPRDSPRQQQSDTSSF